MHTALIISTLLTTLALANPGTEKRIPHVEMSTRELGLDILPRAVQGCGNNPNIQCGNGYHVVSSLSIRHAVSAVSDCCFDE